MYSESKYREEEQKLPQLWLLQGKSTKDSAYKNSLQFHNCLQSSFYIMVLKDWQFRHNWLQTGGNIVILGNWAGSCRRIADTTRC